MRPEPESTDRRDAGDARTTLDYMARRDPSAGEINREGKYRWRPEPAARVRYRRPGRRRPRRQQRPALRKRRDVGRNQCTPCGRTGVAGRHGRWSAQLRHRPSTGARLVTFQPTIANSAAITSVSIRRIGSIPRHQTLIAPALRMRRRSARRPRRSQRRRCGCDGFRQRRSSTSNDPEGHRLQEGRDRAQTRMSGTLVEPRSIAARESRDRSARRQK